MNIQPEKGWKTETMMVPAGVHMEVKYNGDEENEEKNTGEQPFAYPMGVGGILMNGCYGTNYQKGDPCYDFKTASSFCLVSGLHNLDGIEESYKVFQWDLALSRSWGAGCGVLYPRVLRPFKTFFLCFFFQFIWG